MNKRFPGIVRLLALVLLTVIVFAPAGAVLRERTLSKTLSVLCAELEVNYKKQKQFLAKAERRAEKRHKELVSLMQRSQQISLMLYSLPADYVFDITYACEQAMGLYNEFTQSMNSSETSVNYSQHLLVDVNRYDGLIRALENLPPVIVHANADSLAVKDTGGTGETMLVKDKIDVLTQEVKGATPYELTESEREIREKCILYAKALRNNYVRFYNHARKEEAHYKDVSACLTELNDYALVQYEKLRTNALEGGDDYCKILMSLPTHLQSMTSKFDDKYKSLDEDSDWRGVVVILVSFLIIFYMAIASALSYLLVIFLPKMQNRVGRYIRGREKYEDKKVMISYAMGVAIFALALGMVKFVIADNHLILMATSYMYIFAWLFFVIILSLTIRNSGDKLRHGFASYVPFLVVACLVIIMRIVFMPLSFMNLLFPPVMVAASIWQISNLSRHRKFLAKSDLLFAYISLAIMIWSTVGTWLGYTLAAVESIVWWSFQLAFIQTIACIRDITRSYEKKQLMTRIRVRNNIPLSTNDAHLMEQMRRGDFIGATWLIDFIRIVIIPVCAMFSFLASMVCEADFFNCSNECLLFFERDFLDVPDVIQVSLMKLYIAGIVFVVCRYLLFVVRSGYRLARENDNKHIKSEANITLANNVMAILTWSFYCIFCLVLFNVPKSGVSAISAGLATGFGFAMKDLLENFFYGISLMTGRVRVGDYIECDGTFGHVESITYQSTQIKTLDGSIVAFLNKSLFSKNFRNLTRTTLYSLVKLPVGVAYGTDIEHVRRVLVDHLNTFYADYKNTHRHMHHPAINEKGFSVVLSEFGESSVDLLVIFWVLVEQRIPFNALVKEQIYKALNNAGIEIPFPQRDLHIIKSAE
ncbi:MAG: mechanosensitive ion channel family protein [Bacteroidaceae bacterium]|nr:mechanosensitive ion channel family protein [Bacteroidaceae bacterium]